MPEPLVETSGLNFQVRSGASELHILRNVNLTVDPGEVVAVVGPSGSGKTSLLMVLAGLEQATGGTVTIEGREISGLDEDALALFRRRTLGILFQNFHLIPTMTALENVSLSLEVADAGLSLADVRQAARAALESVGLGDRLGHLPNMLSGGEQQRVGLARAIVTRPRLLLADEPTGNLDQETGGKVIDLMFALAAEKGTSVLLITHDPALARRADRILTLTRGELSPGPSVVAS
jgi:putative ABC transport system ATP-binding protein